jgi:hypothetical protein
MASALKLTIERDGAGFLGTLLHTERDGSRRPYILWSKAFERVGAAASAAQLEARVLGLDLVEVFDDIH